MQHPSEHRCPYCSTTTKPFATSPRPRAHCGSPDCRRAHNTAKQREARAAWTDERHERARAYHRSHQRQPNAECAICDTPFVQRTHGKTGRKQQTCSRQCGIELRQRIYGTAGRYVLNGQACKIPWRTCLGCSATFKGSKPRKYCDRCRQVKDYHYWFARRAAELKEHRPRACRICDKTFIPEPTGRQGNIGKSVYCSTECRAAGQRIEHNKLSHIRRARKCSNGPHQSFTIEQIAQRDGWDCHLCGEATERTAHPNSDWYPTIDHLVPISRGGPHTMDNVCIAHRWCNSIRSVGDIRTWRQALAA